MSCWIRCLFSKNQGMLQFPILIFSYLDNNFLYSKRFSYSIKCMQSIRFPYNMYLVKMIFDRTNPVQAIYMASCLVIGKVSVFE